MQHDSTLTQRVGNRNSSPGSTFEIFERDAAGRYVKVVGETAGRIHVVPGCDGLAIDLDALWAELGRLSDDGV
jgi:hypothetical protein